ncbi:MAG: tripartite tricarboxylate transporter TctB family protein [Treponema sp.]|nr:tripartite tricarboxylate transporter TctB family protein [Treponema sp.]
MGIFQYNLWVFHGPGGGLFPAIAGTLLVVCGGITLFRNIKSKARVSFEAKPFILFGVAVFTALLVYLLGIFIPLGMFIFGWLVFMEKRQKVPSLLLGTGTAVVLFVIFQIFLRVPVPRGLVFTLL